MSPLPRLLQPLPGNATLLAQTRWTPYHHRIWAEFDAYVDGVLLGQGPIPTKVALATNSDSVILVADVFMLADGASDLQSATTPVRNYTVANDLWFFPPRSLRVLSHTDWDRGAYLKGAGDYDIFTDPIPRAHLWAIRTLLELDLPRKQWLTYIRKEVGGIPNIKSSAVRRLLSARLEQTP